MPSSVKRKQKPRNENPNAPFCKFRKVVQQTINDYFEDNLLYFILCIDVTVAHMYLCLALVTKKWHASLAPRKEHFIEMQKMHDVFYRSSVAFERYLRIYDYAFFVEFISALMKNAWPKELKALPMYDLSVSDLCKQAKPLRRFCMFLATSEERHALYQGNGQKTYSFWCERFVSLLAKHGLYKQLGYFFEHFAVPEMVKQEDDPGACVEAIRGVRKYERALFAFIKAANDVKNNDELEAFVKTTRDASLETLKALITKGFWVHGSASCAAAAEKGDLELLKFLKDEVKCDMDEETITKAVRYGHDKVWKWARNVCLCPFDYTALVAAASRSNNQGFQALKDLLQMGCEYDEETSEAAARHNNVTILQFLYNEEYLLSDEIPRIATSHNRGRVLEWCKTKDKFQAHINQALVERAVEFKSVWSFCVLMKFGFVYEGDSIENLIAHNNNLAMVRAIDQKTNYKWTSDHLMMAVKHRRFNIFEYLQKKVPNWWLISDTLLDIAKEYEDKTLYQYILDERYNDKR